MAQKFKLRFGDGTTLALDEDGLRTWVGRGKVDEQTTVQPPGAKGWQPLQEFLARAGKTSSGRPRGGSPPSEPESLRLAPIQDEPEPDQDLYDGELIDGPLTIAWLWLKRGVLILALLMGVGSAAAWWPVWLPWVTEHGVMLFTAIDKQVHPERAVPRPSAEEERAGQLRAAHDAATAQLPHLDAATIERVIAGSLVGVLDPAEVFSRSHEAIQRGLPSLSTEEAEEARELRAALQATLQAADRERLREYDRMRALRSTLPFEDREALGLTARAARSLPAPQLHRLQALWAKAVAAGLRVSAPRPIAATPSVPPSD
jgi:hypothetical protein